VLQTAHHFLGRLNSNRPREASTLQSHLFEWFILTACGEILLAFAIFCLLVIYWSIAAPPWATRAFNFVGGHVWHVLILVIAGFFLVGAFVAMNHG
jgi:hypothetical protein